MKINVQYLEQYESIISNYECLDSFDDESNVEGCF